jgi:hypothetical protein
MKGNSGAWEEFEHIPEYAARPTEDAPTFLSDFRAPLSRPCFSSPEAVWWASATCRCYYRRDTVYHENRRMVRAYAPSHSS